MSKTFDQIKVGDSASHERTITARDVDVYAELTDDYNPMHMDDDFAKSVKEWTTRPEFSSPLVDHLPKSSGGVPSPKDVLGYYIGAPKKLTYYADIMKYYQALAAKSPRVRIMNVGKTDEGRECAVVVVGSWPMKTLSFAEPDELKPATLTFLQALMRIASTSL